jgi:hypothetical protein
LRRALTRPTLLNKTNHFARDDVQFPAHDGALGKNWLLKFSEEFPLNCHFLVQRAYTEKK